MLTRLFVKFAQYKSSASGLTKPPPASAYNLTNQTPKPMHWYQKLTIQQRINIKDLSELICGVKYGLLVKMFGMRETIELLHQKLKLEGFDI